MTTLITLINASSRTISPTELVAVASALQIQVDRDFFPIWGKRAVVVALNDEPVPASAWQMRIIDQPDFGLGVHLDEDGTPFAEIEASDDWSVTASHELLEMLQDPLGHKTITGPTIDPESDGHNVSYLVEIADPCETFAYSINGIAVSDFVTRAFYDCRAGTKAAVDFLGRLSGPFNVPSGCYLSWIDPSDQRWHQKTPEGLFTRSTQHVDDRALPREDRDSTFGEQENASRHRLSPIRRRWRR